MAEEPTAPEAPQETAAPETTAETNGSPPAEQAKPARTSEELEAELTKARNDAAKARNEAAGYRVKLKEVEPIAKAAQEAKEAEKTEVQRAVERAQAAEAREQETLEGYTRLEIAVQYSIPPEDIELIGSGTREEMDVRAQRIAALTAAAAKATPPPSDRPVEGLRPGASPEPAREPDDSYPSAWTPSWLKGTDDSRSRYGQ